MKARNREAEAPGPVSIRVLTEARVLGIHRAVVAQAGLDDLGLRGGGFLEAAVARQYDVAMGADARERAAALAQGLLDERPFFEGNTRVAFLALLMGLDQNGFEPNRVSFDAWQRLMTAFARHEVEELGPPGKGSARKAKATREDELGLVTAWLMENTRTRERVDGALAVPALARLLEAKGLGFERLEGQLRVTRSEITGRRFLGLGTREKREVLFTAADPGAEALVPQTTVRELRKACALDPADLQDFEATLEATLRAHATLLPRLAGL